MSPALLFQMHLVLGYVAWLLCFGVYVLPRLESMHPVAAHRGEGCGQIGANDARKDFLR